MPYLLILRGIKNNYKYLIRFVMVGIFTFLLNMTLVWFFYGFFSVQYQWSITHAYVLTTCVHFILNKTFTFGHGMRSISGHGLKYAVMLIINYLLTLGITTLMVDVFQTTPYVGIVVSTMCVAFSSFGLMRYFVFPHSKVNL
jgi:putative flippase GtrA